MNKQTVTCLDNGIILFSNDEGVINALARIRENYVRVEFDALELGCFS